MATVDPPVPPGERSGRTCLILFVKSPDHAPVKSRLAAHIGTETASLLYRNFVLDLLGTMERVSLRRGLDPLVFLFPPPSVREAPRWLGDTGRLVAQEGGDLGERMLHAFRTVFAAGYERAVLVGSDIPDLPAGAVEEALDRLACTGAVIGPARDGGYYLIGFRRAFLAPAVFHGLPWGTAKVFAQTMEVFRREERDVAILPAWRDVDTLEDLRDLWRRNLRGPFADSRTMHCLRSSSLFPAPCEGCDPEEIAEKNDFHQSQPVG